MTFANRILRKLLVDIAADMTPSGTAVTLAVALEEIESAASECRLHEVAHFAGVAKLAAWDCVFYSGGVGICASR